MSGYGAGAGRSSGPTSALGGNPSRLSYSTGPTASGGQGYGSGGAASYGSNSSTGYGTGGSGYSQSQSGYGDTLWVLEPITHEGRSLLLDQATGAVYRDGREDEWPQLVGRMGSGGRIQLRQENTASEFGAPGWATCPFLSSTACAQRCWCEGGASG